MGRYTMMFGVGGEDGPLGPSPITWERSQQSPTRERGEASSKWLLVALMAALVLALVATPATGPIGWC